MAGLSPLFSTQYSLNCVYASSCGGRCLLFPILILYILFIKNVNLKRQSRKQRDQPYNPPAAKKIHITFQDTLHAGSKAS